MGTGSFIYRLLHYVRNDPEPFATLRYRAGHLNQFVVIPGTQYLIP